MDVDDYNYAYNTEFNGRKGPLLVAALSAIFLFGILVFYIIL